MPHPGHSPSLAHPNAYSWLLLAVPFPLFSAFPKQPGESILISLFIIWLENCVPSTQLPAPKYPLQICLLCVPPLPTLLTSSFPGPFTQDQLTQ